MKNGKLNGKVAVVTGASKGIGAGIAKEFAAEGASVVVNYASSKTDADKVVDEITKRGGKAVAVQGSVAKKAEVEGSPNSRERHQPGPHRHAGTEQTNGFLRDGTATYGRNFHHRSARETGYTR